MIISEIYSGIIAGGMLFFAFFTAPLVFTQLSPKDAGIFIRAVFPWYYITFAFLFITLSLLLLVTSDVSLAVISFSSGIAFIIVRQYLMPLINLQSDLSAKGDYKAKVNFKRLHRLSVVINTIQIIAIMYIFYRLAS